MCAWFMFASSKWTLKLFAYYWTARSKFVVPTKAKCMGDKAYYPGCSILPARPSSGISYAWRSILKGVELLRKGIIWRVGNGKDIDIWSDPWIPRGNTRRVVSHRGNNLITKVSELINPITNKWDEELVRQTFTPEDTKCILQIPIQDHLEDFTAWHYDKKAEEDGGFDWLKLWTMPLPNKVLHFLWRLATNSLPLRTKLQNRGTGEREGDSPTAKAKVDKSSFRNIEDQH
ncbi:uncharacterized protein [Triticum aestivum]|uniref:uncharacterized protein n=1 Tax=Triticum aestivum TaxID=4565 RepID=UPI001D00C446|nr:uncharacterized protein LOC123057238 [Triticum aestivum]